VLLGSRLDSGWTRLATVPLTLLYIGPYLQEDPYPFLFGSPARYVATSSLLLNSNRLILDPLPVLSQTMHLPCLLHLQLPLQQARHGLGWVAIVQAGHGLGWVGRGSPYCLPGISKSGQQFPSPPNLRKWVHSVCPLSIQVPISQTGKY